MTEEDGAHGLRTISNAHSSLSTTTTGRERLLPTTPSSLPPFPLYYPELEPRVFRPSRYTSTVSEIVWRGKESMVEVPPRPSTATSKHPNPARAWFDPAPLTPTSYSCPANMQVMKSMQAGESFRTCVEVGKPQGDFLPPTATDEGSNSSSDAPSTSAHLHSPSATEPAQGEERNNSVDEQPPDRESIHYKETSADLLFKRKEQEMETCDHQARLPVYISAQHQPRRQSVTLTLRLPERPPPPPLASFPLMDNKAESLATSAGTLEIPTTESMVLLLKSPTSSSPESSLAERLTSTPIAIPLSASSPSSLPSIASPPLLNSPSSPLEEDQIAPAALFGSSFTTLNPLHSPPPAPPSCGLSERSFHFDGDDMVVHGDLMWNGDLHGGLHEVESICPDIVGDLPLCCQVLVTEQQQEEEPLMATNICTVERLKFSVVQLKNFCLGREKTLLSVCARLDGDYDDVFTTTAVPSAASCVFGNETTLELPPSLCSISLILQEVSDSGRTTTPVGKAILSKEELVGNSAHLELDPEEMEEHWLPLARIRNTQSTQILGCICLELGWDAGTASFSIRVFDYTLWPNGEGTTSQTTPLPSATSSTSQLREGRLYLRVCISTSEGVFSPMRKIKVVGRRSTEICRLDCSQLPICPLQTTPTLPPRQTNSHPQIKARPTAAAAAEEPEASLTREDAQQCSALLSVPQQRSKQTCTPREKTANGQSDSMRIYSAKSPIPYPSPRQVKSGTTTTNTAEAAVRLNIKVYNDSSYDEQSAYCGYARIPLESQKMLPKDLPLGPNWFNIKSRHAWACDPTLPQLPSSPPAKATTATQQRLDRPTRQQQQQHQPVGSRSVSLHQQRSPSTQCQQPQSTSGPPRTMTSGSLKGSPSSTAAHRPSAETPTLGRRQAPGHQDWTSQPSPLHSAPSLTSLKGLLSLGTQRFMSTPERAAALSGQQVVSHPAKPANDIKVVGDVRLRWRYSQEHILPVVHYQPLQSLLLNSLNVQPFAASLISLLQYFPMTTDMDGMPRPLMRIFVHTNQLRSFFSLICMNYVESCRDVNTLFRSQSLAAKVMYEAMKFLGHQYLMTSLKPLIDLIFAERKCCEIDPSRAKSPEVMEHNLRNLTVYAELAFSRVVDSHHRCPPMLRSVFAELRTVVQFHFPEREEVARLAISSFLIMRFFAAAILNPKLFNLRQDVPDQDVARTLVLVSKILQRVANCVVSSHPLTNKEIWLVPVLERLSDDAHRAAMIHFLDSVSTEPSLISTMHQQAEKQAEHNVEKASPIPPNSMPRLLKHGLLNERRGGTDKKRSLRNLINQKRRYVVLTETELRWQKLVPGSSPGPGQGPIGGSGKSQRGGGQAKTGPAPPPTGQTNRQPPSVETAAATSPLAEQRGCLKLADISSVMVLSEAKNTFRVATQTAEVQFQAQSLAELNEWVILLQKHHRRQLMLLNRTPPGSSKVPPVDLERELHSVHLYFLQQLPLMRRWRSDLEGGGESGDGAEGGEDMGYNEGIAAASLPPLEDLFPAVEEREYGAVRLHETLSALISAVEYIEAVRYEAENAALGRGGTMSSSELASVVGLLPETRADKFIGIKGEQQQLVDQENYFRLSSRRRGKYMMQQNIAEPQAL